MSDRTNDDHPTNTPRDRRLTVDSLRGVTTGRKSPTQWDPLLKPSKNAPNEVWAYYYDERQRRKTIKAERRGRIARRESPHDIENCELCLAAPKREHDINVRSVAERSLVSRSHVYRVLDPNVEERRGLRTLATLRRIAHDGLGISLDELAALVLD